MSTEIEATLAASSPNVAHNNSTGSNSTHVVTYRDLAKEVTVYAILYAILIIGTLVPIIRNKLKKQPYWEKMMARKGQVMTTMAEESVLSFAISLHHLVGGAMMIYGQMYSKPSVWVSGMAIEQAFEIVDCVGMALGVWPYTELADSRLKLVSLAHHLPGLVVLPFFMSQGFHNNEHLQKIGAALLFAGGVSMACEGAKQTRDMETQLGQWLSLHVTNMSGVLIARFIIFPAASYNLLLMCKAHSELAFYLCLFGIGSMAFFNVVVLVIMTEKLVTKGKQYIMNKMYGSKITVAAAEGVPAAGLKED